MTLNMYNFIKILSLFFIILLLHTPAYALGGYKYSDGGIFYTRVSFPLDATKTENKKIENISDKIKTENSDKLINPDCKTGFFDTDNPDNQIKQTYHKKTKKLKKGVSYTDNFLGLIETGDGSIYKAAKNGNITKIHYIDKRTTKVYVPFFIPVRVTRHLTIVYGE